MTQLKKALIMDDKKTNEIIKDVDSNICILPYNDDITRDNINIFIRRNSTVICVMLNT